MISLNLINHKKTSFIIGVLALILHVYNISAMLVCMCVGVYMYKVWYYGCAHLKTYIELSGKLLFNHIHVHVAPEILYNLEILLFLYLMPI